MLIQFRPDSQQGDTSEQRVKVSPQLLGTQKVWDNQMFLGEDHFTRFLLILKSTFMASEF